MRILIFIFLFFIGSGLLYGQSAEDEAVRLRKTLEVGDAPVDMEGNGPALQERAAFSGNWNLSAGTSFSYMKGYGSGMGFYAAPVYTLPLTGRWSVHGGLLASHFTPLSAPGGEYGLPVSYSGLAIFGAASFQMNDRLEIYGAGVKQLLAAPPSPLAPYPMDHISLGATYRLGENIFIGAALHMNQSNGFNGGSPFYGQPFTSPYTSPFGW